MRTLIRESIGPFIVVEGWPLFLGVKVFSFIGILLNSLKRDGQDTFLVEKIFIYVRIFRNSLYVRIPIFLGIL